VEQGLDLLARSASGHELSAYHLEAAIAAEHARATSIEDTDWPTIVWLYDRLLQITPSPVIALNRAIAIAQRDGPERGLEVLDAIGDRDRERLDAYPFYRAALGELECRRGRLDAAREHFAAALPLARNPTERRFLEKRLRACSRV
jgi:RNA polymerase sigma-70 factor (ECF subfamily)